MKTILHAIVGLSCLYLGNLTVGARETNGAPARIGIYDSRAVAYAHFWSEAHQKFLKDLMAAANAAKQSGDTNKFNEYKASLRAEQYRSHRQVFSTAPADNALAAIQERIPEIQSQAGVTVLVSKWDDMALKSYKNAEIVEVTDRLVHEFIQPNARQSRTISDLQTHKPLPLKKCDELIRQGKL